MAIKIVKDSDQPIHVKQVQVQSGGDNTTLPAINSLWQGSGNKIGLIGDTPRLGQDGNWYATVDTAALIRVDAVAVAFTDGQAVYWTGSAFTATASTNKLIGYADKAKSGSSGPLFIQLVPHAA